MCINKLNCICCIKVNKLWGCPINNLEKYRMFWLLSVNYCLLAFQRNWKMLLLDFRYYKIVEEYSTTNYLFNSSTKWFKVGRKTYGESNETEHGHLSRMEMHILL